MPGRHYEGVDVNFARSGFTVRLACLHRFWCIWKGRYHHGMFLVSDKLACILKAIVLQGGRTKCALLLADAGAIKVRPFYFESSQAPSTRICRRSQILVKKKGPKDTFRYDTLTVFGLDIVALEGEARKKYRKFAAPAFSEVSPRRRHSPRSECDH